MGDFEITNREILFSIIIAAIMIIAGTLIHGGIVDSVAESNIKVQRMARLETTDKFNHGLKTNIGDSLTIAAVRTITPVTHPEIEGEYMTLERVYQEEELKTRIVSYTDSDGNIQTRTEVYCEWETKKREYWQSDKLTFNGYEIGIDDIRNDIPTQSTKYTYITAKKRYCFHYRTTDYNGAATVRLTDGAIKSIDFHKDLTIEQLYKHKLSSPIGWLVFFWILWALLICGSVYLFYRIDNRWLEEHKLT